MTPRIGVVAAMPGEIAPLVKRVGARPVRHRAPVRVFESDEFVIACAGIGKVRAILACEAVAEHGVRILVSAGWVGALRPEFRAAQVVAPGRILDEATGERFLSTQADGPLLLTAATVLGKVEKARAAENFHADLVDMEAAHVARFARGKNLPFACIRSVSDAADDDLPDMQRFIRNGDFHIAAFIRYVAIRPQWWGAVTRMAKHSSAAAQAMAEEIARFDLTRSAS